MVRNIVSLGLEARAKAGIKVRQPLSELRIKPASLNGDSGKNQELRGKDDLLELIKDEVNVKSVVFVESLESEVELDTNISEELKQEGEFRDLVRLVQDMRKEKRLKVDDKIELSLAPEHAPLLFRFEAELKRLVCANSVTIGEHVQIVVT